MSERYPFTARMGSGTGTALFPALVGVWFMPTLALFALFVALGTNILFTKLSFGERVPFTIGALVTSGLVWAAKLGVSTFF